MACPRKLILVRHSESRPVEDLPPAQWGLTRRGRIRCAKLALYLRDYELQELYASQERKAQETAALVAARLNLPVRTYPDLHEHVRVGAPFLPREQFVATIRTFFQNTDSLVFGSETASESYRRFARAIDLLVAQNERTDVAIVTHGTVISLFVGAHSSWEPFEFWRRLRQPGLAVFEIPSFSLARTAFTV